MRQTLKHRRYRAYYENRRHGLALLEKICDELSTLSIKTLSAARPVASFLRPGDRTWLSSQGKRDLPISALSRYRLQHRGGLSKTCGGNRGERKNPLQRGTPVAAKSSKHHRPSSAEIEFLLPYGWEKAAALALLPST